TIETEAASSGKGNFNFKRQFGGQLETLVGSFDKTLNPFYDILKKTLDKD
ncbi:peptidoglycan branched peptide synthesis protein, alanine adding enzyme, partial [Streptococcus thermophilus MTCC 5460]